MWFPLDKSYFKRLKFSDILYINSPQKKKTIENTSNRNASFVSAIFRPLSVMLRALL